LDNHGEDLQIFIFLLSESGYPGFKDLQDFYWMIMERICKFSESNFQNIVFINKRFYVESN